MSDNKDKPSKSRKMSSKAPQQIVNFFSKPATPIDVTSASTSVSFHLSDRKRKLPDNNLSTENENPTSYAQTLRKDAEKIAKIEKANKIGTMVSTFFQKDKNDSLSDFESPNKRMQIKAPPVLPKKKVTRKRKQPGNQKATKDRNALETEIFEKVLLHHSVADGLNSDELQMAIALSRSLTETHGSSSETSNNISSIIRNAEPSDKADIVRTTFQKFGFKKRDNNDYDYQDFFTNVATNKKWTSKFTALTRRSENIQKEKFKKKVKIILQISESSHNLDGKTKEVYRVTSSYLQQFFIPESPAYNISTAVMETRIGAFYTTHLVPVSTLRCGSMLKNWDEIAGRDISPERNILPSWDVDYTLMSLETQNEKSEETENPNKSLPTVNVLESISNLKTASDLSDNTRLPDAHDTLKSNIFQVDAKDAFQHTDEPPMSDVMDVDIIPQIEERRVREESPDMFAEYDSSANNSLNDDKSITNHNESYTNISAGYHSVEVANDDNIVPSTSKNDITSTNVPAVGSTDRCNGVENFTLEDYPNTTKALESSMMDDVQPDCLSFNECDMNNEESKDINDGMDDEKLEMGIPVIQNTAKEVVLLSSDDSNQSLVNLGVSNSDPSSETRQHKLSIINSIKSVTKHLSFTERLELYNSDPALGNTYDATACCHRSQSSQDSIVISDDEINYSLNPNGVYEALNGNSFNMHSQESIELSDSGDDHKKIDSQRPDSEIEERESFRSLNLSNDSDCASEKSLDINFDDENFNSNHSLEEDLINISVREMCQKEFVSGSAKPSTTKNFSRTVSDMTFERSKVKNIPTTPVKFIELSDDEFDEFDELIKGLKNTPVAADKSIEIRHHNVDKLLDDGELSDLAMLNSPPSSSQSNEFIVQSMDQIYEVRTGLLVSPKPDYENMNSPTRLEHLKKYGLKALSKRKAVICLEHIYNRLHPFIELDGHDEMEEIFSQKKVTVIESDKRIVNIGTSQQSTSSTFNNLRKNNVGSSTAENNLGILQENEGVFYLPSAPRAKKPWCLQPLHIAWHNLIQSNSTLYDHILQYKPIDITDIRSLFKSIDLRYETNDIISFLDQKCITFKTDNKRNNVAK